ncbi:hypothetical protein C2G38_2228363 [Gigaspora rosea]|uniref:Uncharacterized protein n=1 Tax=Gigaspora rosea TaxID=44941 RepID=A0A397U492_9GLOM|nr:hypothetical protein C2G38_2228363 [Gigaspora rosea]
MAVFTGCVGSGTRKTESSSDITNNDTQLYLKDNNLQDFSQDFLNEIVNEMCNRYIEENNQIKPIVQIILANCYYLKRTSIKQQRWMILMEYILSVYANGIGVKKDKHTSGKFL